MLFEGEDIFGGELALCTSEMFHLGMYQNMTLQLLLHFERVLTLVTLVGLLTVTLKVMVLQQILGVGQVLTFLTFKRVFIPQLVC